MTKLPYARGASSPAPGQSELTNADCWATEYRADVNAAILVVCDGVSSAQIGRGAANVATKHAAKRFREDWTPVINHEEFLKDVIIDSHLAVLGAFPGQDAACTMVAAIVISDKNQVVIGHVGDSMAYLWRPRSLQPLTTSHTQAFVPKRNGMPILQAGVPVVRQALNRFIGQSSPLEPEISKVAFEDGDVICLASDGIPQHQLGLFLDRRASNPSDKALRDFCEVCSRETDDDATLLFQHLGYKLAEVMQQNLAKYDQLTDEERDGVLAGLIKQPHVETRAVFRCLRKENNQDRALKIANLLKCRADEIEFKEWNAILDLACARDWKSLRNLLIQVMRTMSRE